MLQINLCFIYLCFINLKFMEGLNGFILNLTFLNVLDFYEKSPRKKKKTVGKNCFDEQEKPWTYLKIFRKKHKNFKAIWAVLGHSEPKIFSVDQPWWPTFSGDLTTQTPPLNYFTATTALLDQYKTERRTSLIFLNQKQTRTGVKLSQRNLFFIP